MLLASRARDTYLYKYILTESVRVGFITLYIVNARINDHHCVCVCVCACVCVCGEGGGGGGLRILLLDYYSHSNRSVVLFHGERIQTVAVYPEQSSSQQ